MKLRIVAGVLALVFSGTAAWSQVTPGSGSTGSFGAVVIGPPANTNNPGLTIIESTPATGTPAGPISLNLITAIDGAQAVTGGFPQDQWGQITNQTDVFRINYQVTGGSANHFGLNVATQITGTNGGTVPLISGCYVNVGPITGDCWVNLAVGTIGPSGKLNQSMIGYEAEMAVADTGTLLDRIGFSADSQGPTVATRYDEAISINTFNLGATHFMTAAPWSNGIHFNNGLYGSSTFPVATTGSVILADTGTVANFISAHTLAVTGNILDFPSVNITGTGSMNLGAGSSTTSNSFTMRCSTCGVVSALVNPNGTSGVDLFEAADSSGLNNVFLLVGEASNSSTRFGQTFGNWAEVAAQGSTNVGLMVGTVTSEPLILGTNNTARMTFGGASGVTMNTSLAMGSNNITGGGTATFTTFVGALTGHGSLDLALTGGTMSGAIAMGSNNITGGGSATFTTFVGALTGHASLDLALSSLGTNVQTALGAAIGASGGIMLNGGATNTSLKTFLDINANTSSSPALVTATDVARFQSADGANGGFEFVSYGGVNGNIVTGASANGTSASPSASSAGVNMFNLHGTGYNGTSFQTGGIIVMHPTSTWSGTNQQTQIDFYTTALNSTSVTGHAEITPAGGFLVGRATPLEPGNGVMNLLPQAFASLTACSSTIEGSVAAVIDSSTAAWGATITGSSTNHVQAYCDGTNWTVAGK